ncbi:Uncharacterised protein [BD1-7 clade bacterium]|uniref:Transposase IS200-like domain-containing protein n=1 Tax=BD1-7 clade bacterium TaxID=2029982 RepID=A0A5S9QXK7_9GAMM|nr:Uncharacterised protein [BD1-7 clade bacterium]
MARLPRPNLPGIPQHVVQRGNNRQACFFADEDYAVYLDRLHHYATEYDVAVQAFVMMTNHVHLHNGVRSYTLHSDILTARLIVAVLTLKYWPTLFKEWWPLR